MTSDILGTIIKSQEDQKKAELNPGELVNWLLRELASREKDVVKARYGLEAAKKQTLESIGKKFGITRERVRQIENNGVKKAQQAEGVEEKLEPLNNLVIRSLKRSGHIKHEEALFQEFLEGSQEYEIDKNRLRFILAKFLHKSIEPVVIVETERAWKIKNHELKHYEPVVAGIKNILTKKNAPLEMGEIMDHLKSEIETEFEKLFADIEDAAEAVRSCLEVSKYFKSNLFDKWGLSHWRLVSPKRMRDKIYLVLQKDGKPLHYKRIAERINEEKFDKKIAHPATIHNELILDDRFVLIGRGIYALKEWGYKPGVISDVIKDILLEAGRPMSKEEIAVEVLKHREVKEGSINLTLSDKERFVKAEDGRYRLRDEKGKEPPEMREQNVTQE